MMSDEMYSNLPWPKGWSASGWRLDIFALITDITEVPISERLLKASEVMAILPISVPIISFTANKITLQIMPRAPLSVPYLSRTILSFTFL